MCVCVRVHVRVRVRVCVCVRHKGGEIIDRSGGCWNVNANRITAFRRYLALLWQLQLIWKKAARDLGAKSRAGSPAMLM